ncbi:MAG: alanine--tRNA ligase [Alphaproteobacteria bacterium]|jgi:alanyl-tRNA synthetase|tara:strand:+ start:858 stop:3524 length:2667 start_codon:yes stop_codon:yes gene_type:complete
MNSTDVRNTFIDYFKKNNHEHVRSSPLVPDNDPTLMFTNSGMVQFKNIFTGLETKKFNKATTSQKCVRAGGKHNDLENVGFTTRHHTFFEMLGNFSFGDYFKEQAIYYAWDLITNEYGINKDKLLVTIYHNDEESYGFWKKIAGLRDDRIIRIDTSDNFWSMGDVGPCGPCSEIFYDHGDKYEGGPPGSPNEDGDRFIEIWNLVFMQFEQINKETRINLPKPCVDTGMGLERITALLNGSNDNYSTDLFTNVMEVTSEIIKAPITIKNQSSFRIIADHLRASSFLIADGVLPSNEGRGYVLRRILRRGIRHAYTLGSKEPIFFQLFPELKNLMSSFYPELKSAESLIIETLQNEESKFRETLTKGLKILNEEIEIIKDNTLNGDVAFKLYDTFGFPLDLTQDFLKTKNISVNVKEFDLSMNAQKIEAKASWKGSGDQGTDKIWYELSKNIDQTIFEGYEKTNSKSNILRIIKDSQEILESSNSDDQLILITENTPFYAETGGQIGDKGHFKTDSATFKVSDTQKTPLGLFLHLGHVLKGRISLGDSVEMIVDSAKRELIKKNHSATHLLHASLRNNLGKHVAQKGSLVNDDKLRFDFSHNKSIDKESILKITNEVNQIISQSSKVITEVKTQEDAVRDGAMALFGEKYGDEVRVVSMGKKNEDVYSMELCGGIHVSNTNEIQKFHIIKEESIASGIRRIEAITYDKVDEYILSLEESAKETDLQLDLKINSLVSEMNKLGHSYKKEDVLDKNILVKSLENKLQQLKKQFILTSSDKNKIEIDEINNLKIKKQIVYDLQSKDLRSLYDDFKNEFDKAIFICACINEDKVSLVVGITPSLLETYDCRALIKNAFEPLGSKGGGGRQDFAQAGGSNINGIELAFKSIVENI